MKYRNTNTTVKCRYFKVSASLAAADAQPSKANIDYFDCHSIPNIIRAPTCCFQLWRFHNVDFITIRPCESRPIWHDRRHFGLDIAKNLRQSPLILRPWLRERRSPWISLYMMNASLAEWDLCKQLLLWQLLARNEGEISKRHTEIIVSAIWEEVVWVFTISTAASRKHEMT